MRTRVMLRTLPGLRRILAAAQGCLVLMALAGESFVHPALHRLHVDCSCRDGHVHGGRVSPASEETALPRWDGGSEEAHHDCRLCAAGVGMGGPPHVDGLRSFLGVGWSRQSAGPCPGVSGPSAHPLLARAPPRGDAH